MRKTLISGTKIRSLKRRIILGGNVTSPFNLIRRLDNYLITTYTPKLVDMFLIFGLIFRWQVNGLTVNIFHGLRKRFRKSGMWVYGAGYISESQFHINRQSCLSYYFVS